MTAKPASATRIALSLLGAARGRALSAPAMLGAGAVLGVSSNAMRVALSRLTQSGDVVAEARGLYALAEQRRRAIAHVRTFRTGFAARVAWQGGFLGVLTSDLSRRNVTSVRKRERAFDLVGMRRYRHGLYVRPDNLEGGLPVIASHLVRLGLDEEADVIGLALDASQVLAVERLYDVRKDEARAIALEAKVRKLLVRMEGSQKRTLAADSFFLGDEVLRFLARDPLLPESLADPAPRRALADAMSTLDERGFSLWQRLLHDFETRNETP